MVVVVPEDVLVVVLETVMDVQAVVDQDVHLDVLDVLEIVELVVRQIVEAIV